MDKRMMSTRKSMRESAKRRASSHWNSTESGRSKAPVTKDPSKCKGSKHLSRYQEQIAPKSDRRHSAVAVSRQEWESLVKGATLGLSGGVCLNRPSSNIFFRPGRSHPSHRYKEGSRGLKSWFEGEGGPVGAVYLEYKWEAWKKDECVRGIQKFDTLGSELDGLLLQELGLGRII